jgi:DNA-binding MarR family transcriptional regulator
VPEVSAEFDAMMRANAALHRTLLAIGESIASTAGQSHARSMCLRQIAEQPLSVAAVAGRLEMSRQSVQRVADLLVADGLAGYAENPRHRRAQLLTLTAQGEEALRLMHEKHQAWVRRAAARLQSSGLADLTNQLSAIRAAIQEIEI